MSQKRKQNKKTANNALVAYSRPVSTAVSPSLTGRRVPSSSWCMLLWLEEPGSTSSTAFIIAGMFFSDSGSSVFLLLTALFLVMAFAVLVARVLTLVLFFVFGILQ